MPLLFSYGTLQQEEVQLSTFGRRLQGQRDELPGFEPALAKIEDSDVVIKSGKSHHANVKFNGRSDSSVSGTVFAITDAELDAADQYEKLAAYKRVAARLASGKQAWMYVDARSATGAVGASANPGPQERTVVDTDLDGLSREQLIAEVRKLRNGIREHRDGTGHDLCWHHPRLWGLLPEKSDPIPSVPEWPQFLAGCIRYRQSLDEQVPTAPRTNRPYDRDA